ncbi:MAG: hypothetical protein ACE362_08400 [Phaeodactylibacter xiamenensis]|uniref:Uncharacterized protein n=1 Tax=Phaeodactylibacter xiamenensis TaxID=1524460 RepID=A0A098S7N6_9BACT|nr:hypothetical protein [Phaeodactylibacter xiamenensis]KGE88584.1 hypothetical protein IX84_07850 [Phaeodactylibacter xiamenensis]
MKLPILAIATLLFALPAFAQSPYDFDSELSDIARSFRNDIMDEYQCQRLKGDAGDLANEIEDAIEEDDEYSDAEMRQLGQLKKEAKALEQFIAAVGNCANYLPSISEFHLANQRVRADVSYVSKDQYCVDFVVAGIGNYVAYLAVNSSPNNYTVSYKWKAPGGMDSGNGTMGLPKSSVRHIYNNREEVNKTRISVYGVSCKEF